jgi:acyl-CoA oxidase
MMLNGREVDRKTSGSLPSNMESLHLETVGAKLYASEHASRGIEVARLVCGGHGNPEEAEILTMED